MKQRRNGPCELYSISGTAPSPDRHTLSCRFAAPDGAWNMENDRVRRLKATAIDEAKNGLAYSFVYFVHPCVVMASSLSRGDPATETCETFP
jgi:hypothetical protein